MTLGRGSAVRMDLAAIRLDEVEQVRPGLFRHRESLAARLARRFPNPFTKTQPADAGDTSTET